MAQSSCLTKQKHEARCDGEPHVINVHEGGYAQAACDQNNSQNTFVGKRQKEIPERRLNSKFPGWFYLFPLVVGHHI
jgi:hypothetical protein